MKNDFTKTNLFSCPIYKIRINPNSYDKEKILNDIKYNKSLKNTRNDPHQNVGSPSDIHHSYKDHTNVNFKIINYKKLIDVYLKILKEFFSKEIHTTKEFSFNFDIVNYLAMTEGQRLPRHTHVKNDDFATVHYLNFKDDHKFTSFDNPVIFAPYAKHIQPELYNILNNMAIDNSYLQGGVEMSIEEDDILIFPGALNHKISAQGQTKEPRITVSTNLEVFSLTENKYTF